MVLYSNTLVNIKEGNTVQKTQSYYVVLFVQDVIVGKIYFLLVRIKIKHMEIAIIKRETCGSGPNTYHENENIAK